MSALEAEDLDSVFRVLLPPRPYPGLRPFEKEEWPIFFGRERMVDAVVGHLIGRRLLVIHGDSGCGKSSLVRAGVLPRLEQENARGGIRWRTCSAMPREAPLWNLAQALADLDSGSPDEARPIEIRRILNFGRDAPAALAGVLRRSSNDHHCILIDQFEELFDHARRHGPDEARLLTEILVGLLAEPPDGLYAIITMRSEFLGACARYEGLAETVNETQYLLPRMNHSDLLRAIREPAALYGGEVTLDLADRLIADAGGGQDELPLIQHGLMLLHRDLMAAQSNGLAAAQDVGQPDADPAWRIGVEHLPREGGLAGLLSNHADAVMLEGQQAHLGSGDSTRLFESLFRALIDINAEGQAVRRPQSLAQLVAVTGADEATLRGIVDGFRLDGVSFLKPYGSERIDRGELIDVSHEALIRRWRRIAEPKDGWLIREFRDGLVWRALLVQADSFERDSTNVLGSALTNERERWLKGRTAAWALRYGGGWERVQKLVETSVAAAAEARQQERERLVAAETTKRREVELQAAKKLARRTRLGLVATTILGLAAAWLAMVASIQRQRAEELSVDVGRSYNQLLAARETTLQAREEVGRAQASYAEAIISALATRAVTTQSDTEDILADIQRTTDPYRQAVLAQSLARSTTELSEGQTAVVLAALTGALRRSADPSTTAAIAQAIQALAPRFTAQQVEDTLKPTIAAYQSSTDPFARQALEGAVQALQGRPTFQLSRPVEESPFVPQ